VIANMLFVVMVSR